MDKPQHGNQRVASLPRPDPRRLSGRPLPLQVSPSKGPGLILPWTPALLLPETQMGIDLHPWMTPVALEMFSTQGCPL